MERKLAHIEKIEWIKPIQGADNIVVCGVLGWECVAKKNEFNVGDKIVYIEVDSVMLSKPEYEFLKDRKYRVKTIKLKGQVSQGLVIPLPNCCNKYNIGYDVTDIVGVTKYLTPSEREEFENQDKKIQNEKNKLKKFMMRYSWCRKFFLSRKQKEGFPYWISKTDEERIQNIPQIISQYKDSEVYITEKIDYQSATFTGKNIRKFEWLGKLSPLNYKFIVCSRNLTVTNKNTLYWNIANKYNIEKILKENPNLTIQGEQGDSKVQGNKYGIKEPKFWIFNIIDHDKNYHYNYDEMKEFCQEYNLNIVPLVKKCKISDIGTTVQDFVEYSKGKSVEADIQREGIVIRSIVNGKKVLSFKVINPNFLLKYND